MPLRNSTWCGYCDISSMSGHKYFRLNLHLVCKFGVELFDVLTVAKSQIQNEHWNNLHYKFLYSLVCCLKIERQTSPSFTHVTSWKGSALVFRIKSGQVWLCVPCSLQFVSFVSQEREDANTLFKSKKGKELQKEIAKKSKTFVPGAGLPDTAKPSGLLFLAIESLWALFWVCVH